MDLRDCSASLASIGDDTALDQYLSALYPDLGHNVKPAVMKFGAVGPNEIRTKNLYLTNYNPVPINVTVSVSGVTGLEVNIGRVEASVDDFVDLEENGKMFCGMDSMYASKIFTPDVSFSDKVPLDLLDLYDKITEVDVYATDSAKKVSIEEGNFQSLEGYKVDPGEGIRPPKWKNTGGNGVLVR